FVRLPGGETDAAHGGDAREGLAAKAPGRDRRQVVDLDELAGGVPRERKERILGGHALPVVADDDALEPSPDEADVDAPSGGVEGVLDQLPHDGGGTLDDFAGGDLRLHRRREDGDPTHGQRMRRGFLRATQSSAAPSARNPGSRSWTTSPRPSSATPASDASAPSVSSSSCISCPSVKALTTGSVTVALGCPRNASDISVARCSAFTSAPSEWPPRYRTSSRSWYAAGTRTRDPWSSTRRKSVIPPRPAASRRHRGANHSAAAASRSQYERTVSVPPPSLPPRHQSALARADRG